MKKLTLSLISLLLLNNLYSQQIGATSIEDRVVKSMSKITSYITLSDQQYNELKKLYEKIFTDNEKAKEAVRISKENKENFEDNLFKILNEDQSAKYKQKQKEYNDSIDNSKLPPWKQK